MGDGTMLLLGLIIGLLCAALVSAKAVEDALHTGYQDGLRDGAEEARIMWENQMKEDALFAKNAEDVSGDDGPGEGERMDGVYVGIAMLLVVLLLGVALGEVMDDDD